MKHPILLPLLLIVAAVHGQPVPPLINYQGRLANPDGSPFPTADYELRVAIYDAAVNGTLVWGPQVFDGVPGTGHGPRLPVVQGYFNVMLGPVDTQGRSILEAFGGSNRFVEVTVSNRAPILPRQQILPAPFAVRAANGVPPGTVVAFAGNGSVVPEGWLLCDGRAFSTNRYPDLWAVIGTFWGGSTNDGAFNIPDLRGLFLRGVDFSPTTGEISGQDPDYPLRVPIKPGGNRGRDVGSFQGSSTESHRHYTVAPQSASGDVALTSGNQISVNGYNVEAGADYRLRGTSVESAVGRSSAFGGNETRPKNAYVNYLIKH